STNKFFDVNIRCVYGLRAIGKGSVSSEPLFGLLNLPNPPEKFSRYNDVLLKPLKEVATETMISATEESVSLNLCTENEDEVGLPSRDFSVGIDGT
ncbi:hypothetical protein J6590_103394, partial [Homalodisca vitripennis]